LSAWGRSRFGVNTLDDAGKYNFERNLDPLPYNLDKLDDIRELREGFLAGLDLPRRYHSSQLKHKCNRIRVCTEDDAYSAGKPTCAVCMAEAKDWPASHH
jgi:hypothetical protein